MKTKTFATLSLVASIIVASPVSVMASGNASMSDTVGGNRGMFVSEAKAGRNMTSEDMQAYYARVDELTRLEEIEKNTMMEDEIKRTLDAGEKKKYHDTSSKQEEWVNPDTRTVYTNVDCFIDETSAPEAMKSLGDGLDMYNAVSCGKTMHITSETSKEFSYPVPGCDGAIKVSAGGVVTYIPNLDTTKNTLRISISGSGAYTPVKLR